MIMPERELLSRSLLDAQTKAEEGRFEEALSEIATARALGPKNIYLLAFEKQVEQLIELSRAGILTDDQRTDILESIPGIVERALDGSTPSPTSVPPTATAIQREDEKAAAHEWLKNQYFQHAHEYVRKGEYENALAEIRRVYIIEPGNRVAHDFEVQIEQLAEIKRREFLPPLEETAPSPLPTPMQPVPGEKPVRETSVKRPPTPAATPAGESGPAQAAPGAEEKPKKKTSNLLVALILLTIATLGGSYFYFWMRGHKQEKARAPIATGPSHSEGVYTAPTTSPEQTFMVSATTTEQVENGPATTTEDQPADKKPSEQLPSSSQPPRQEQRVADRSTRRSEPASPPTRQPPSGETQKEGAPPLTTPATGTKPGEQTFTAPEPFVGVEEEPKLVRLSRPAFPDFAYREGLTGQVVVQVQINPEGKPLQAKIQRSTNPLLDQALMDAVMRSEFTPARMTNGPVTSWLAIPFNFKK